MAALWRALKACEYVNVDHFSSFIQSLAANPFPIAAQSPFPFQGEGPGIGSHLHFRLGKIRMAASEIRKYTCWRICCCDRFSGRKL